MYLTDSQVLALGGYPLDSTGPQRRITVETARSELQATRAITLKTPWSHLIAHHGKNVENRTWLPPAGMTRLVFHAGYNHDPSHALRHGELPCTPARAAFVAVADLVDVCDASFGKPTVVCDCGEWAQPGQMHWKIDRTWTLGKPVPVDRGRLRCWKLIDPEIAALADQMLADAQLGPEGGAPGWECRSTQPVTA